MAGKTLAQATQIETLTVEQLLEEDRLRVAAGQGVRAQLIAVDRAVLSAGIAAQISVVAFRVGEAVKKGELLVGFDCASLHAQQKIYQAQQNVSQINFDVKTRLQQLNSVGIQELDLSRAELASTAAQLEVINVEIAQCQVKAPFSGTLVARNIEPFQYVNKGEPILELLSKDNLEVLLVAPSHWLQWMKAGESFTIGVEEIDEKFSGVVTRLSGRVDPVSQTFMVYGKLTNGSERLLPGMSGDISFENGR